MSSQGFIGVDLDGTLAKPLRPYSPLEIGEPILPMLRRVRRWLDEGRDVRIVTARVAMRFNGVLQDTNAIRLVIDAWCRKHVGRVLAVQCGKDSADVPMAELWDDRAVRVRDGRRVK